jgi:adenine-specific DNA-methyltransferase
MAVKYIPYYPDTLEGQALLDNFVRTRRILRYRDNDRIVEHIQRGMPLYEVEPLEKRGDNEQRNLIMHGECLSTCAYLKEQGIEVDLVYIDPPFASGADYAKKIYIRRNPLVRKAIKEAEQTLDNSEMKEFEEKMYGDIWDKERYLNWMYENLMAIKSVMSETASIYVHLDYHIGHYVKILMDEIFGEENFRNEIVWHYYNKMQGNVNRFASNHDSIYYYTKSNNFCFTPIKEKRQETTRLIKRVWDKDTQKLVNAKDENGKVIYIESEEKSIDDVWRISMLQPADKEEPLDYATQKPEALLERIIKASSNEGMLVADFFGGSGVTATVAHKLGRRFIHGDVNINSLQTARDRLVNAGAEFEVLEVKDGVRLFRNPVQTMDKLKNCLIRGLRANAALDRQYWAGSITDSKHGMMPVYLPDLLNSSKRVMDKTEMMNIIHKALPDLLGDVRRVIIYYVDIDDLNGMRTFIEKENRQTLIEFELRDLKQVLDQVVLEDKAEWTLSEAKNALGMPIGWLVTMKSFHSNHVKRKVYEFNMKGEQQTLKKKADGKKTKFVPISLSDEGLETIEWLSVDCTTAEKTAPWHSDTEIQIEKDGTMTINGKKTTDCWDGTLLADNKPLRLKVRNICGDETVFEL